MGVCSSLLLLIVSHGRYVGMRGGFIPSVSK